MSILFRIPLVLIELIHQSLCWLFKRHAWQETQRRRVRYGDARSGLHAGDLILIEHCPRCDAWRETNIGGGQ